MTFQQMNAPMAYNYQQMPQQYQQQYPGLMQPVTQEQIAYQQQQAKLAALQTPEIVPAGKSFFKVVKSEESKPTITVDALVESDMQREERKRGGKRKREEGDSSSIIKADNSGQTVVEDIPTAYSYMETTGLLHETLAQIDAVNSELMQQFNTVKSSRTMEKKYGTMIGLSENIGSMIQNRIQVIKEMNATIKSANELDYKISKDRKAANAAVDDDKYIADLYKAFIQNPTNLPTNPQVPQVDPSIFGSGIVRADLRQGNYTSGGQVDVGYLNYLSNLSPQQNLMRYEGNNNVKQVVVFDAATGNKFFQYMDLSTMQVIPNVETYDPMFMEDVTIDKAHKIAKSINLNETFPLVIINDDITSNY